MSNYQFKKQLYFLIKEVIIAIVLLIAVRIITPDFKLAIIFVLAEIAIRHGLNYAYKKILTKISKEDPFDNNYTI